MPHPLEIRLRERRERRSALERELISVEAEIRAYEDAVSLMTTEVTGNPGVAVEEKAGASPKTARRSRLLSPHWAKILTEMARRYPTPTSIAEIVEFAASVGLGITKPAARSQMSLYTARGITERVEEGRFRVHPSAVPGTGPVEGPKPTVP